MIEFSSAHRRRRTLALGVVVLAYVLAFFQRVAPAGIVPDLAHDFQASAASLGLLAAVYFYVYTLMQIPAGILVDSYGPRRVLFAGGLVGLAGGLLFAFAIGLGMALAGRVLIGLGVSVTFIAMLKIVAVWYEERRFATLVGICLLLGNCGAILAGAPLSALAQALGWRSVFAALALASGGLGLACWLLVRDRPASVVRREPRRGFDRTVILKGLLTILRNPATWPVVIVNCGISGSFFAFGGLWAMPWLMQVHGHPRDLASLHLSLLFAGFALGSVLLARLSDRLTRRRPVLIVASHLYAALWLVCLQAWPLAAWLSALLFVAMGVATASFTLTWACAKEVNPPLLAGMSTSIANMGGFLVAAVLLPLVGWLMDLRWDGLLAGDEVLHVAADFRRGLLLLAGSAWVGALASWRIRETGCRNVWMPTATVPGMRGRA